MSATAEHAARSVPPPRSRFALWQAVQLVIAVGGTMALVRMSGVFAAFPDMTSSDRWQLALEVLSAQVPLIALEMLVLQVLALRQSAPRALHILRFCGMVLLGTVGAAAPVSLMTDAPSVRLGIAESKRSVVGMGLFDALLMATFLVYQQRAQAKSEEASRRLRWLQREQQAARRRLVEAQLQAMQARVDPQMFFDVLDSVQRLYATDPPRAEAVLDELVVFLRAALPRLRSASSTVAQELELAASYFRLQASRGSAPATVRITLPDALAARAFPAGVILPLLSDARTAAIDVDAQPGAGEDDITVSLRTQRAPASQALAQVRETLAALYGSAATLECCDTGADTPIETRITVAHAAP